MLDVSSGDDGFSGKGARSCDTCRLSVSTIYCYTDSAYLCIECDKCIHTPKPMSLQHERVWVCTVCKNAPAAFNCKADAASLCTNCDAEIHSANPLARRHIRVPESPIGVLYLPSPAYPNGLLSPTLYLENEFPVHEASEEIDEDETGAWLVLNPDNQNSHTNDRFSYGGEVDEYLNLAEYNSFTGNEYQAQFKEQQSYGVPQGDDGNDGVVPVKRAEAYEQRQEQEHNINWGMNHEASKSGFNYTSATSKSVHMPPTDSGIVPVATVGNISNPPLLMPLQFSMIDREAKVLRYREKRKTRKFDKKIRYASRKAYAETRPRVKGRFARRTDMELEMDHVISIKEYCYSISHHF